MSLRKQSSNMEMSGYASYISMIDALLNSSFTDNPTVKELRMDLQEVFALNIEPLRGDFNDIIQSRIEMWQQRSKIIINEIDLEKENISLLRKFNEKLDRHSNNKDDIISPRDKRQKVDVEPTYKISEPLRGFFGETELTKMCIRDSCMSQDL